MCDMYDFPLRGIILLALFSRSYSIRTMNVTGEIPTEFWNIPREKDEAVAQEEVFPCPDGSTISIERFCDGTKDCDDNLDEETYHSGSAFLPLALWQSCNNAANNYSATCRVRRDLICREKIICKDIDPCDLECDSHYRCQNSSCVRRSTVCDGNVCFGCKEDHEWENGPGFKCIRAGKECVLPQQLLHDNISDCDGGVDICYNFERLQNGSLRKIGSILNQCFRCLNDKDLIPWSKVCDGMIDCPDLSDECPCIGEKPDICDKVIARHEKIPENEEVYGLWTNKSRVRLRQEEECTTGTVRCEAGACILRESVCDGYKDCDGDEKESFCGGTIGCKDSETREVCRCENRYGECERRLGTTCDGIADCIWDDLFEASPSNPEDECDISCSAFPGNYSCSSDFWTVFPGDFQYDCWTPSEYVRVSNENETFDVPVYDSYIPYQECDGWEDCPLFQDELNCTSRYECTPKADQHLNPKRISIPISQVCDGREDCVSPLDQISPDEAHERCSETRFFCPALDGEMISIDRRLVCDFRITCDDNSDEMNCPDDRFYCENKKPLFVRARQKFDGFGDCSDWSDECPTVDRRTSTNSFSSRYEMIANPILRTLVWIMGLLSVGGNLTVLYLGARNIKSFRKLSAAGVTNKMLVMSLASADIIMGIYLITLAISGVTMQGSYCSLDLSWRSSDLCVTLGILSVLSSQSSVITMIMLTSCRLYAVLKPMKASVRPRKRTVCLMIFAAWAIALMTALVPIAPGLSNVFATHAQLERTPYITSDPTPLDEARQLFNTLMTYDLKDNVTIPDGFSVDEMSWSEMESYAEDLFTHENFKVVKLFGYYSIHSVCIPKFFVTRTESAWKFSLSVNIFNFCSFIYVALAYAAIYSKSRQFANVRSPSDDSKAAKNLQRKISRLIVTDFCCWIPICIMAFAKFGGAEFSNTAYALAAIVLLPINSALNPLLYSNLPDILHAKLKGLLKKGICVTCSSETPKPASTISRLTSTMNISAEDGNLQKRS